MLHIRDLSVSYGAVHAVRGIDLEVEEGECVALLGPNGAGKTSTLRAASAFIPHGGEILFEGRPVNKLGPEKVARLGLIHVPEGRRLFKRLSVDENLKVGLSGLGGRSDGMTISEVYDLFPALVDLRGRAAWALSGGEQQMVAIGRALVASPRLLLLDEPSLGLSPKLVKTVYGALREIRRTTTLLLVEQNTAAALDLCDRGFVLASGEIVLQGTAAELNDRQTLVDSYLGRTDTETSTGAAEPAR